MFTFFLLPFLCFFQLEAELVSCEKEEAELQEYANQVLQQIADRCPDILEQVVNALEDSCWLPCARTRSQTDWKNKKSHSLACTSQTLSVNTRGKKLN